MPAARWIDASRLRARLFRGVAAAILCASAAAALEPAAAAGAAPLGVPAPDWEFERIVDSVRVAADLPALAAAVITGDSVLARAVTGTRRAGGTVPATVADRFHLGSDTKSMTAGLLGLLVDARLLAWTTTLADLWPELATAMRPEYRDLTVTDLLAHRSGLPRDPATLFTDPTLPQQRISLLRWATAHPPTSDRGAYAYSNVNYAIAGAVAERVTGRDYETLMAEMIFTPLGIGSAGWGAPGIPARPAGDEDQPWQHRVGADGVRTPVPPSPFSDNPPVMSPAGRVHMSIDDWARWGRAVLRAASGRSSLWQTETAAVLTTPLQPVSPNDRYGYGWMGTTRPWAAPTGRVLTHMGSNTMNVATAWLAPDADFGILVVTNQGGREAAAAADALVGRLIQWRQGR